MQLSWGAMNYRLILFFLFLMMLFIPLSGKCNEGDVKQAFIEYTKKGCINWTDGFIRAKGIGIPSKNRYGKKQSALETGMQIARNNLLEVVKCVRINAFSTVKDLTFQNENIISEINNMVKSAQIAEQKYMSDGMVEVTIQLSMYGGFAQLVLPKEIKQIESIKTVATEFNDSSGNRPEPEAYTKLVVDARGLGAKPAMAPTIQSENGREIYGPAFVSREFAVQQGMGVYAMGLAAVGNNRKINNDSLIIKALRIKEPENTDIIISNTGASRILSVSRHLLLLKECRLIILID